MDSGGGWLCFFRSVSADDLGKKRSVTSALSATPIGGDGGGGNGSSSSSGYGHGNRYNGPTLATATARLPSSRSLAAASTLSHSSRCALYLSIQSSRFGSLSQVPGAAPLVCPPKRGGACLRAHSVCVCARAARKEKRRRRWRRGFVRSGGCIEGAIVVDVRFICARRDQVQAHRKLDRSST